ncbi:MAG TPA: maleylpyruvate isomerase N-terminal domain-containing protein [Streptosporangiaceae bacterium]|nr:maleylpyruvate isomerase N-terminal domain-containing protein [Streptosporangiaceae bacterium]
MAQTETIVAAVRPDQLGLPTPCSEYDVRALLSHTVGGLNRIAGRLQPPDVRSAERPARECFPRGRAGVAVAACWDP